MRGNPDPIGVILAGGSGRRIGGSKATVQLHGRPLISYPLEALRRALDDVAVIAKADTELPGLPGVTVWIEPDSIQHPLVGLVQALGLAGGRRVLVCAVDLPFVSAELIVHLAATDPGSAAAVVASSHGALQPLLGCYEPRTVDLLNRMQLEAETPVRDAIAAIGPALFEIEDHEALFNVNSPDDLLQAAAMLDRRTAASRR